MNALSVVVLFVALATAHGGVLGGLGVGVGHLANAAAVAAHSTPIVTPGVVAPAAIAAPGVIAARHSLLGHGVVAAHAGLVSPITASGYPLLAPGSGIEGQYIHDNSGNGLDGQYIHDLRGSGIDGQYVHDFTETLFDSGKYHGELVHKKILIA